jgi:hypothetical protein
LTPKTFLFPTAFISLPELHFNSPFFPNKRLLINNRLTIGNYQMANKKLEYSEQWLVYHVQESDKMHTACFNKSNFK